MGVSSYQGTTRHLRKLREDVRCVNKHILDQYQIGINRPGGGTDSDIFGLNSKGLDLLEMYREQTLTPTKMHTKPLIMHQLLTADVIMSFRIWAKEHGLEFIDRDQLKCPRTWRTRATYGGKTFERNLEPDYVFGIRDPKRTPGKDTMYFFLESDRATEPVRRRSNKGRSLYLKYTQYAATHRAGLHKEWGMSNFRVIFITTGKKRRLKEMVEGAKDPEIYSGIGGGMMLFASWSDLKHGSQIYTKDKQIQVEDLLTYPFQTISGTSSILS